MPAFDYALVRAVRVETGEAVALGAVLSCRQARFLEARLARDLGAAERLGLDAALLRRSLAAFEAVARGDAAAGPVARLPPSERFHFLTAVRSTALQASPVRTGLTDDPAGALARIARGLGLEAPGPAGATGPSGALHGPGGTPPARPRV